MLEVNEVLIRSFILLFIALGFSGCALNNSDSPLGELKGGKTSNDPDYYLNLWPEKNPENLDPQQVIPTQTQGWPKLDKKTVLFVGDESIQGNWGLVLKNMFSDSGANTLFLSGCEATANHWKSGLESKCGLFSAPFTKYTNESIFLTTDLKAGSERALPTILSNPNVTKIVLSFGFYLKNIKDSTRLQEELVALEILAKWAHSTGKICHFVAPVGEFFLETGYDQILSEDMLKKIKVLIDPYCYWVDSQEARDTFLAETQIDVSQSVKAIPQANEDYIELDDIEIESNLPALDLSDLTDKVTLPEIKDIEQPEIKNEDNTPKDQTQSTIIDASEFEEEIKRPPTKPDTIPQVELPETGPKIQFRPKFISVKEQEAIRDQIEKKSKTTATTVKKAENRILQRQEPKYLWNGRARGDEFTKVGKEELARYGEKLFKATKLSDATKYCANYWNLSITDRRNVWLFLYSAMAMYESSFKPHEKATEVTGGTSMGLFQMDYNNCKDSARNAEDLLNPRVNFRCAIRKSSYLVNEGSQIASGYYPKNCNRQGCKYMGGAMDRFWSTLRNPYTAHMMINGKKTPVKVGKRPKVIAHLQNLPHCKK